jgi:hypothetical protein
MNSYYVFGTGIFLPSATVYSLAANIPYCFASQRLNYVPSFGSKAIKPCRHLAKNSLLCLTHNSYSSMFGMNKSKFPPLFYKEGSGELISEEFIILFKT